MLSLGPFDAVIANPMFHMGMECIVQSLLATGPNPKAVIVILLPTDYFDNASRYRIYADLPIYIDLELRIGRWSYLNGVKTLKRESDSIFVLKYGATISEDQKFAHRTLMRRFE